jgi:hypothetical protein
MRRRDCALLRGLANDQTEPTRQQSLPLCRRGARLIRRR